eukprot:6732729-Lingulodinium_polyedra.AAC.1
MGAVRPGLLRGRGQLPRFEEAQGRLNNVARGKGRGNGLGPHINPRDIVDAVRLAGNCPAGRRCGGRRPAVP